MPEYKIFRDLTLVLAKLLKVQNLSKTQYLSDQGRNDVNHPLDSNLAPYCIYKPEQFTSAVIGLQHATSVCPPKCESSFVQTEVHQQIIKIILGIIQIFEYIIVNRRGFLFL